MKNEITRRSFVEKITLASMGAAFGSSAFSQSLIERSKGIKDLDIHIFSKHLQFLNYKDMADAAANIGFNGVDLTVRPKGHVLPNQVKDDLPRAIEAIKNVGFVPKLMTSSILSTTQEFTRDVLETAANMDVKFYRMGYYKYPKNKSIPTAISTIAEQVKKLSLLNEKLDIKGAYQNHAGEQVGANIWEIWEMLKTVDNNFLGCQFDIRHATVEGGKSWPTSLKLIKPKINSLVLKDFKWALKNGKWDVINTPIGKGMVDFKSYFKLLRKYEIQVPISLHCEYDLGGAEHGKKDISISQKEVFAAMKKDVETIRRLWNESE